MRQASAPATGVARSAITSESAQARKPWPTVGVPFTWVWRAKAVTRSGTDRSAEESGTEGAAASQLRRSARDEPERYPEGYCDSVHVRRVVDEAVGSEAGNRDHGPLR